MFDPSLVMPNLLPLLHKDFTVLTLNGYIGANIGSLEPNQAARVDALVDIAASAQLIDTLPNLRIISSPSAGLDKLDLEACRRRSIAVTYAPALCSDDVADLAILFMLAACRRLCTAHQYVRQGSWSSSGDSLLTSKASGRQVGIIGLGQIGKCIAKRAAGFDCSISYHGRSSNPHVPYTYYSNVVEMARDCSVLFIACSLTEETRHMVDTQVLNALGPQGILVNIARGQVVREADLIAALKEGRLGFAGLDVFEKEPQGSSELTRMQNVVLSPHIGNNSHESRAAVAQCVVANLEAFFSGKPLLTPVNY